MSPADATAADFNRLRWQCRRGMRELDELLESFLLRRYAALDARAQHVFSHLLEYPDTVLLELLMGRMTPAEAEIARLVAAIRDTAQA
jgi:antitoxin CptB